MWRQRPMCHTKWMDNATPPKASRDPGFPRTSKLPSQSPLFWVQQKDRYLRQLLISDIEAATGRRFIVYFANRFAAGSDIQFVDIAHFAELVGDLAGEPIDILLETGGGLTDTTEALISLLKNVCSSFRVVVANAAKSNGTLLALAAESIVMGATSELGPIEPSLQGIPCSILDSQQIAAQNFPLHMMGKYALQQSRNLAVAVLTSGMMKGSDPIVIDTVVNALATRQRFPSHGSVVDHQEASTLGLKVTYLPPDDDLWKRIWLLYSMYDHDCRVGNLLKIFEGRARSLSIAATPAGPQP